MKKCSESAICAFTFNRARGFLNHPFLAEKDPPDGTTVFDEHI